MLFNSLDFAIFLPIVFILYWFVINKSLRLQNFLIVIASYVFYGWWDWRFLSLVVFSTLVDYFVGVFLSRHEKESTRKILLLISIVVNLGFLGFFKYYNFFLDNFISAFSFFGREIQANSLHIILPVGISFYTFQTISYSIDVYRKKLEPTKDFIAFTAYVSFFPQLVAGPIERATHFLPQFLKKREFDYAKASDGLRQVLWGFFKKVLIADNCAEYVDTIFNNSAHYSGSTLLIGVIFFSIQIYGDFSGYSDIAIGTARLFGFNLMRNFAYPYFSRDIAEFWRRWHISLSSWFRDYVYIPLGGSRGTISKQIRNVFIIFVVSGFWHGANWTFIVWGALNAVYFLPLLLSKKNRSHLDIVAQGRILPSLGDALRIASTYFLTLIAWVFFRADTVTHAINYIRNIFSLSLFSKPSIYPSVIEFPAGLLFVLIAFLIAVEWIQRDKQHALEINLEKIPYLLRWTIYTFIIFLIGMYMPSGETPFIYFQF